jgi:hypothetical protein
MYSATAYNHAYGDSGIFCINASAHPNQLADLVQVGHRRFVFSLNSSTFCINASAHPIQLADLVQVGHRHFAFSLNSSYLSIDENSVPDP